MLLALGVSKPTCLGLVVAPDNVGLRSGDQLLIASAGSNDIMPRLHGLGVNIGIQKPARIQEPVLSQRWRDDTVELYPPDVIYRSFRVHVLSRAV